MPCRSQKDVQTRDGVLVSAENASNGNIGGSNRSVKSQQNSEVSNERKVTKAKTRINDGSVDDGTENNNINNSQHQINDNKMTKSETDLPRPRTCCTAADVQTKDSLTPVKNDSRPEISKSDNLSVSDSVGNMISNEGESDDADTEDQRSETSSKKEQKVNSKTKRLRTKPPRNNPKNPSKYYHLDDDSQGKSAMSLSSFSQKKGKYSLAENDSDADGSVGRPLPQKAPRKKSIGDKLSEAHGSGAENYDQESKGRPKKKKGKKKKEADDSDEAMEMRSVYENQIASLQDSPSAHAPAHSKVDLVITGPPTVEMEEDLLENAEEERRKNKQRLREKRRTEKEYESPVKTPGNDIGTVYETAQKEIDKVLGPRKDAISTEKAKKKSSKKEKKKEKDEDNTVDSNNEEIPPSDTLEEARVKIHRLLDDAFSLMSQSRSSMGNKVHPASQQSSVEKESPRSQHSQKSHSSLEPTDQDVQPVVEEKKHTPLFVERSHGAYDKSGLISWSPYRASDDTALISLPNCQTNLNNVAPQREPITSTTVFSESLPSSLQPNYFTTLPGEPIVLHTKDLSSNPPSSGGYQDTKSSTDAEGKYSRAHDEFLTPYYGMSSYHELPPSSVITPVPQKNDGRYSFTKSDVPNGEYTNAGYGDSSLGSVKYHSAPSNGRDNERKNDVVDVIKHSVQPGASPQPLIHSLREELLNLSRKKGGDSHYSGENGIEKSTSKDGKASSLGQDVHHQNRHNRNRHMKTEL